MGHVTLPTAKSLGFAVGIALIATGLPGCSHPAGRQEAAGLDKGQALRMTLRRSGLPPQVDAFYAERGYQPIWVRNGVLLPRARELIALLQSAKAEGLEPQHYLAQIRLPRPQDVGKRASAIAELSFSQALVNYLRDLTDPPSGTIFFVDDHVPRRRVDMAAIFASIPHEESLQHLLAAIDPPHPFYYALRAALGAYRSGEPRLKLAAAKAGDGDPEKTLLLNMQRMRALPSLQGRYLVVDTAAARLLMMEGGRVRDKMRVIIGKADQQTPDMAAELSFVVLNPYWNIPPDLAAKRAKRVLDEGPAFLKAERLEMLSGWSDDAHILAPNEIDWVSVAAGTQKLRMRQLPGPQNMMGKIKFMMPNPLGIYLHDTPHKDVFAGADRRLSSGCVRLQDPDRLARWLFGSAVPRAGSGLERRVDLPAPVPVYILYLTAMPDRGGVTFRRDIYARDSGSSVKLTSIASRPSS